MTLCGYVFPYGSPACAGDRSKNNGGNEKNNYCCMSLF